MSEVEREEREERARIMKGNIQHRKVLSTQSAQHIELCLCVMKRSTYRAVCTQKERHFQKKDSSLEGGIKEELKRVGAKRLSLQQCLARRTASRGIDLEPRRFVDKDLPGDKKEKENVRLKGPPERFVGWKRRNKTK